MSNFFYSLTGAAFLAIIQYGVCNITCKPPTIKPNEKIEVEIMFVGEYGIQLGNFLCELFPVLKDFINIKYRMGAQSVKNGKELWCGEGVDCYNDRCLACKYQIHGSKVFNGGSPCDPLPKDDAKEVQDCIKNGEADSILISNGDKRKNYGIPSDVFSTLAFNGTYDPCVNPSLTSAQGLKSYICKLTGNSIRPCQ